MNRPSQTSQPGWFQGGKEQGEQTVHLLYCCDYGQGNQPEPEQEVNLLINDIDRKDAETVKLLDSSRWSELVEGAFCHLRKDFGHGINSLALTLFHHTPNLTPICSKFSIKEEIYKIDLSNDIDKIEELAEEESCCVPRVFV